MSATLFIDAIISGDQNATISPIKGHDRAYLMESETLDLGIMGGSITTYLDGTTILDKRYKEAYERLPYGSRVVEYLLFLGDARTALGQIIALEDLQDWKSFLKKDIQNLFQADAWVMETQHVSLPMALYAVTLIGLMGLIGCAHTLIRLKKVPVWRRCLTLVLSLALAVPSVSVLTWTRWGLLIGASVKRMMRGGVS